MDEPAVAQSVARWVQGIVFEVVAGALQPASHDVAQAAFECSCGAVVASYSREEREQSLLEQLSDTGWPRGERRAAVQGLADLVVANASDRSMFREALGLLDAAFRSLSLEDIETALASRAAGLRLVHAARAFGTRGSSLAAERERMRKAIARAKQRRANEPGDLKIRFWVMDQMRQTLLREASKKAEIPDERWPLRVDLAVCVVGSAVLAARHGDRKRLTDLSRESMPLVERKAVFVEFLRKAKGLKYEAAIHASVDRWLADAELSAWPDDDPIRRGAQAALQTGGLGFKRKSREPLKVAVQRVNDDLRRARVPKSRAKRDK